MVHPQVPNRAPAGHHFHYHARQPRGSAAAALAMKRELSMLMLLLAADSVADCVANSNGGKVATATGAMVAGSAARSSAASMTSTELFAATSSLDGPRLVNTKVSRAAGSTEEAVPEVTSAAAAATAVAASGAAKATAAAVVLPAIAAAVIGFMPWRDALVARGVCRAWFRASLGVAAVLRMPATGAPGVFIPCPRELDATEAAEEAALSIRRAPHSDEVRVFIGQLRRDGSVPLLRWVCDAVACLPSGALSRVDNHRHKVTGRGKGCAWAFVRGEEAAQKLLSLHRRSFYDSLALTAQQHHNGVTSVEGMWYLPAANAAERDAAEAAAAANDHTTELLAHEAAMRGFAPHRPRHMPRNALVVELPASALSPHHQHHHHHVHSVMAGSASSIGAVAGASATATAAATPTTTPMMMFARGGAGRYGASPYAVYPRAAAAPSSLALPAAASSESLFQAPPAVGGASLLQDPTASAPATGSSGNASDDEETPANAAAAAAAGAGNSLRGMPSAALMMMMGASGGSMDAYALLQEQQEAAEAEAMQMLAAAAAAAAGSNGGASPYYSYNARSAFYPAAASSSASRGGGAVFAFPPPPSYEAAMSGEATAVSSPTAAGSPSFVSCVDAQSRVARRNNPYAPVFYTSMGY